MDLVSALLDILQKSTIGDVIIEMMSFMAPIWIAIVVGGAVECIPLPQDVAKQAPLYFKKVEVGPANLIVLEQTAEHEIVMPAYFVLVCSSAAPSQALFVHERDLWPR
nr:StAR-related lipid transfer protein 7, mitochondrial [Ipomoea batatas]